MYLCEVCTQAFLVCSEKQLIKPHALLLHKCFDYLPDWPFHLHVTNRCQTHCFLNSLQNAYARSFFRIIVSHRTTHRVLFKVLLGYEQLINLQSYFRFNYTMSSHVNTAVRHVCVCTQRPRKHVETN